MWSTPLHLEAAEEEIFYVLDGTGISVQSDGYSAPRAYEVGAGDVLVHLAVENAHTLQAGPEGLEVLAFGQRSLASGATWLPRAGVAWFGPTWVEVGGEENHPYKREAVIGPPEVGELQPRPASIINVADLQPVVRDGATVGRRARYAARDAGSARTGMRHVEVLPGKLSAPPHCHSAEEEIFVVLDGVGELLLWEPEGVTEYPVRTGSVVARPAGTGVAHAFRAGGDVMTLLMYGTRDPRDVCFYPRSGKVAFSGLGLVVRLGEPLDYWDGED
jgi:uncharacterized cupin superfamily protein